MKDPFAWQHYEVLADRLKTVAHPHRLCLLRGLAERGDCNVSHMQACMGIPQSTLSHHLARMKAGGIITGERRGTEICYHITDKSFAETILTLIQA